MHIKISYLPGFTVEGDVLFYGSRFLRVTIPGRSDVADFRFWDGEWYSETGNPVELDPAFSGRLGTPGTGLDTTPGGARLTPDRPSLPARAANAVHQ